MPARSGVLAGLASALGLLCRFKFKQRTRKPVSKSPAGSVSPNGVSSWFKSKQKATKTCSFSGQAFLGDGSKHSKKVQKVVRAALKKGGLKDDAVFLLLTTEYNQKLNAGGQLYRQLRGKINAVAPEYQKIVVVVLDPELKDVSNWSTSLPRYLQDRWVDLSSLDWQKPREPGASKDLSTGTVA